MVAGVVGQLQRDAVPPDLDRRERIALGAVAQLARASRRRSRSIRHAERQLSPRQSSAARHEPSGLGGTSPRAGTEQRRATPLITPSRPAGGALEPSTQVPLAGPDRHRDGIPPPRGGQGIDRAVGAIRVPRAVEVEPVATVRQRHQLDETARQDTSLAELLPSRKKIVQLGFLGAGRADPAARERRTARLPTGTLTVPASTALGLHPVHTSTRCLAACSGGARVPANTSAGS